MFTNLAAFGGDFLKVLDSEFKEATKIFALKTACKYLVCGLKASWNVVMLSKNTNL